MKDINSTQIEKNDILAEITGGCYFNNKQFDSITLWEYRGETDGSGYQYNIENNPYLFWWARPNKSFILNKNKLSEDFLFSFYHGMNDLIILHKQNNSDDIINIILNDSNWKEKSINGTRVEIYKKQKSLILNNIEDIKNNKEMILSFGPIPNEIKKQIFKIMEIKETVVNNGEIGIAAFDDMIKLNTILMSIFK